MQPTNHSPQTSTNVRRSWFSTVCWSVLLAGDIALFVGQHNSTKGLDGFSIVFLGGLGLLFLYLVIFGSDAADCPNCQDSITIDKHGARSLCGNCFSLSFSKEGKVYIDSEYFVSKEPSFAIPMKPELVLPPCCAHCGKSATKTESVSFETSLGWKLLMGAASLAEGQLEVASQKVELQVPCCDQHEVGAVIKDKDKAELILYVRSYKFAKDVYDTTGIPFQFSGKE